MSVYFVAPFFETGLFLMTRFAEAGGRSVRLHVHDFLVAEADRLAEAGAGSVVLSCLACALLLVKLRLGCTDLLPSARIIAEAVANCPGISRYALVLSIARVDCVGSSGIETMAI